MPAGVWTDVRFFKKCGYVSIIGKYFEPLKTTAIKFVKYTYMIGYYLLLALNVSFAVTRGLLIKKTKTTGNGFYSIRFNVMLFFVAVAVLLPFTLFDFYGYYEQPLYLNAVYGVALIGSIICSVEAIACGSVSLSLLFYQSGFLIPTIFGAICFNEKVGIFTVAGLVLIVVSLVMTIDKSDKKFSTKWLVLSVLGLLFCGLIGIVQKLFSAYRADHPSAGQIHFTELSLAFALVFGLLAMLISYLIKKRGDKDSSVENSVNVKEKQPILKCVFVIIIGALVSVINVLNTIIAQYLPSVVFFPVFNVGVIVLSTIASALLFKEKLSVKQVLSVVGGSLAIVFIAIGQIL